jgi:hypothetical protein
MLKRWLPGGAGGENGPRPGERNWGIKGGVCGKGWKEKPGIEGVMLTRAVCGDMGSKALFIGPPGWGDMSAAGPVEKSIWAGWN